MSDFNEEPYSAIFASLKHPIRRKILRMLSEKTMSFSEMLETLEVSSSFLTYHLENLGELVIKTDDGKYKLSSFGKAALATMTKVEDIPSTKNLQLAYPTKLVRRTTAIALGIVCILLVAFLGGAIAFYASTVSDKDSMIANRDVQIGSLNTKLSNQNSTIVSLNSQISQLNSNLTQLTSNLTDLQNQLNEWRTTYPIYTRSDVSDGPYFDVTPTSVRLGAVGQTFKVTIALHGVTVENVPAGIGGLEVHMIWNTSLVQPVNSSLYIGTPEIGALVTQTGWQAFYDSNGSNCNQQLAQATEFDAGGSWSFVPWWNVNSTGIVAVIAFNVTSPPSSSSTICSLQLSYADLLDSESNEVPVYVMLKASSVGVGLQWDLETNFPAIEEDCYANIIAYPTHGDSFVLSYRFLFYRNVSGNMDSPTLDTPPLSIPDWINETMTKNGNTYSAIISALALPYYTMVQWKVTGYDNGQPFQSLTYEFTYIYNWPE